MNTLDSVWEYAQKNPQGFTLNIETMKAVKFGIVAAYRETQNSFGRDSLEKVIEHALKHDKVVGGWLDETDNRYYFDSCKVFNNRQIDEALQFGRENEQIAIFDLTNLNEIRL